MSFFKRKNNDQEQEQELKQELENKHIEISKKEVELKVEKFYLDKFKLGEEQYIEYECKWHNEKAKKEQELIELDARIESTKQNAELLEEREELLKSVIKDRDKEIERLTSQVESLQEGLIEISKEAVKSKDLSVEQINNKQ